MPSQKGDGSLILKALEIASGTGQHVIHFAHKQPYIMWQPSECDDKSLRSIASYIETMRVGNVSPALWIDTTVAPSQWTRSVLT